MCYFRVCSRKIQYQQNDSGEKMCMFIHHNEKLCKILVFTCSLVCSNYCIFQKSYIPDRKGALIRSLAGLPILCASHSLACPFSNPPTHNRFARSSFPHSKCARSSFPHNRHAKLLFLPCILRRQCFTQLRKIRTARRQHHRCRKGSFFFRQILPARNFLLRKGCR